MPTVEKIIETPTQGHPIYALEMGRSDNSVLTAGGSGKVGEWSLKSGQPEEIQVNVGQTIFSLCHMRAVGWLLIGRSDGGFHVVDIQQKQELRHFKVHQHGVFAIEHSPATGLFFTLGGSGTFAIWDANGPEHVRSIPLGRKKLRDVALSPDQSRVAVASGEARIHVMDTDMFNELFTLSAHDPGVNSVLFHPDGRHLISAGRDAHIRFWDLEDEGREVKAIPAHNFPIYKLAISPSGTYFASASRDKTAKLWDLRSGEILLRIDRVRFLGHSRSVNKVMWHSTEDKLMTTGDDGKLMVWNVESA